MELRAEQNGERGSRTQEEFNGGQQAATAAGEKILGNMPANEWLKIPENAALAFEGLGKAAAVTEGQIREMGNAVEQLTQLLGFGGTRASVPVAAPDVLQPVGRTASGELMPGPEMGAEMDRRIEAARRSNLIPAPAVGN